METFVFLHTHQHGTDADIIGIHAMSSRGYRGGMLGGISSLLGLDGTNDNRIPWELGQQIESQKTGTKMAQPLRFGMETKLATDLWDEAFFIGIFNTIYS
mmetsp:Transcript_2162/g.3533  ORF Transcript_2162/g.3533 Transcript_2162/m.3533 type:complete len:100 (-) Transcript_2162:917-1216(-)